MSDFPKLEPAFTARLFPKEQLPVGKTSDGSTLNVVTVSHGTVISEPGFSIPLESEFAFGSDYVRVEPAGTHARINVKTVLKNKDGALLSYSYTGVVEVDPDFMLIFTNDPQARTTSYGKALSLINFESGDEKFKELEHSIFVGSAHFVALGGGKFLIETKISRVLG